MPFAAKPTNLLGSFLTPKITSQKVGVVVSAGKMAKAVKVRIAGQEWNKHIRKYFPSPTTYLVADPNSSLVEGDVVRISSGHRTSRSIHHVVTAIVAPFGRPVNERPPVLTIEQLASLRLKTRLEKDVRSAERGRLTSKWRLKEAQKAGHAIPDLETAMRGVRLEEERRAEGGEAHRGQAGQAVTSKERRRVERVKTKEEVKAEAKVKRAKAQTQPKTAIPA